MSLDVNILEKELRNGNIELVLEALLSEFERTDNILYNSCFMLNCRWDDLTKEIISGTITPENKTIRQNKIRRDTLQLLLKYETEIKKNSKRYSNKSSQKKQQKHSFKPKSSNSIKGIDAKKGEEQSSENSFFSTLSEAIIPIGLIVFVYYMISTSATNLSTKLTWLTIGFITLYSYLYIFWTTIEKHRNSSYAKDFKHYLFYKIKSEKNLGIIIFYAISTLLILNFFGTHWGGWGILPAMFIVLFTITPFSWASTAVLKNRADEDINNNELNYYSSNKTKIARILKKNGICYSSNLTNLPHYYYAIACFKRYKYEKGKTLPLKFITIKLKNKQHNSSASQNISALFDENKISEKQIFNYFNQEGWLNIELTQENIVGFTFE